MSDQEKPKNPEELEGTKEPPKGRTLTRADFLQIAGAVGAAGLITAVSGIKPRNVRAAPKATTLDPPILSCGNSTQHTIFLQVCAGPSGAPAGFSLHWVKHSDYPSLTCGASGETWPSTGACDPTAIVNNCNVCSGSFSGVPGCSNFNLGPNQCISLEIGNLNDAVCAVSLTNCGASELDCGTEYVFRAFAHNVPGGLNRSGFTPNACCSTEPCALTGCTFTQGYWKNHPCEWPLPFVPGVNGSADSTQCGLTGSHNEQCACDAVNTINIGSIAYTQCDLLCSLAQAGEGNAVRILAHQLIAAKLNILNGASPPPDCNIAAADALINGTNILTGSVDPNSTLGQQMTAAAACLDLYNNGDGGLPHCA